MLFNHVHVIGFLYIQNGILTKAFLPKRTTDFSSNTRTVTAVSGTCWEFTSFRVADKILFSDVLTFGHAEIDAHFSSISVGPFLSEVAHLAATGIYPKLPVDLEKTRGTAWMHSLHWILPLVCGAVIEEGPTSDNDVIDILRKYHKAAEEWGCIHEDMFLAHKIGYSYSFYYEPYWISWDTRICSKCIMGP